MKYLETAGRSLCIDHHITNTGFADENWIDAQASSTAELVWQAMDEERISKETAESIYVGIINDTGVFQYTNTTEKTMQIAGKLMAKGIDFSHIIEETFYRKTYVQNQVLGRALMERSCFWTEDYRRPDSSEGYGVLWRRPFRSGWNRKPAPCHSRRGGSHFPLRDGNPGIQSQSPVQRVRWT